MDDLFSESDRAAEAAVAPLAVRVRPRTLDDVVGQEHLTRPGGPLRLLVDGGGTPSVLLWGPPGTGKTTLAHVVAAGTGARFRELSAVSAGVKDVRAEVDAARRALTTTGERTVLFVDEVHRFSKAQQDSLLGPVENRHVTLVAATTENPSFSVVAPLLSRSLLLTLHALDDDGVRRVLARALTHPEGLAGRVALADDAREHLVRTAAGDARRALTALEAAADAASTAGRDVVDLGTVEQAVDRAALRYDRDGDEHYDVTSAFIKSMRGSDPDATLHYLARVLDAGEDPRFVARRIVVQASEDVGLADPTVLPQAVAAWQALELLGLPEARIPLAQAALAVALAPKSNSVVAGIDSATADVHAGRAGRVPAHLRDSHHSGAQRLGHGVGYRYAHDYPGGVVRQQYPPDELVGTRYYEPTRHGHEAVLADRLDRLRAVVVGDVADPAPDGRAGTEGGAGWRPRCTPEPVAVDEADLLAAAPDGAPHEAVGETAADGASADDTIAGAATTGDG